MFDFYLQHEYWFAAVQLILAMLGMGMTLAPRDFVRVASEPKGFGVGIVLQVILVPALAYVLVLGLSDNAGLAVGLAICAAVPGGTVSNVFTYYARGDIALSISLTAVATLGCLISTPLILEWLVDQHMPEGFVMPSGRIAMEIGLTLLLPLALGMLFLRLVPAHAAGLSRWCIRGSLFVILLIVIGALGAGRLDLESFGLANVGWVFGFVALLAMASFVLPLMLGLSRSETAAINIEITVRNTNLGLLIKASLLPAVVGVADPVGDHAFFTILLYGGLMLILSGAMVPWHRRRMNQDQSGVAPA